MSTRPENYADKMQEVMQVEDALAELRAAVDQALERAELGAEEGAPAADWDG